MERLGIRNRYLNLGTYLCGIDFGSSGTLSSLPRGYVLVTSRIVVKGNSQRSADAMTMILARRIWNGISGTPVDGPVTRHVVSARSACCILEIKPRRVVKLIIPRFRTALLSMYGYCSFDALPCSLDAPCQSAPYDFQDVCSY